MTYRVLAPLVLARDKEGKTHHVYQDGVIDWLPEDQRAHFLDVGLVENLGGSSAGDGDDSSEGRPAKNATKPVLIAWIVANVAKDEGIDYTSKELEEWKVPELRDLVDSVE